MTVREMLFENQDVKYGDFHSKLIPGIDRGEIIGVRLPVIRKIAKKAALDDLEINTFYYEEKMINGMVIEYNKKLSLDERFALLDDFVPLIDNWAICDCCCATYKFTLKNLNEVFNYILKYKDGSEYEVRFMCVMMLDYFLKNEFIAEVLSTLLSLNRDEYYINMAVAWALATAYVNFKDKVNPVLENKVLPAWVHNKTIQKICESYRICNDDKKYLKREDAVAVSLTLPLREAPYETTILFPFFDGLIPEGWLLGVVSRNWKINQKDRFGLLLAACRDCIGDVCIRGEIT